YQTVSSSDFLARSTLESSVPLDTREWETRTRARPRPATGKGTSAMLNSPDAGSSTSCFKLCPLGDGRSTVGPDADRPIRRPILRHPVCGRRIEELLQPNFERQECPESQRVVLGAPIVFSDQSMNHP